MIREDFKIDLFIFCTNYTISEECKNEIYNFLVDNGFAKNVKEFYEEFIKRQITSDKSHVLLLNLLPHKEAWKENYIDSDTFKEMFRQISKVPDIVDNPEGYSWQNRINIYYYPHYKGVNNAAPMVIINQPFELRYDNESHQHLFKVLFAEMFSQTKWPEKFLQYHLAKSFNDNRRDYAIFLELVRADCENILGKRIDYYHKLINDLSESRITNTALGFQAVNQAHIALQITYQQLAGTLDEWPDRAKMKAISTIAEKFSVSPDKLLKFYRKFHDVRDCRTNRLNYLSREKNRLAVKKMLEEANDEKALLELKREIDKVLDGSTGRSSKGLSLNTLFLWCQ